MTDPAYAPLIEFCLRSGLIDSPDDSRMGKFEQLTRHMLEVNARMNLTAITDPAQIVWKHYIDSLCLLAMGELPQHSRVIDVGSGAGFPALPLAIMRSDLRVTALDSTAKKARYIGETAVALGVNVKTMAARAEEAGRDPDTRHRYDIAVARGVSAMGVLSELCLPLVKVGGAFLAMKGPEVAAELEEAARGIELLGGKVENTHEYEIGGYARSLVVIRKVHLTPALYPRAYAQITKSPL